MSSRTIEGEYLHVRTGHLFNFEGQYKFSATGIVYTADVVLDGKRTRLVHGVIPWGVKAIPPRYRVKKRIHFMLECSDASRLLARLNES